MLLLTCKPMVSLRPPKVKIVGLGKLVFQSLGGTLMSLYTLKNFTKPCHFTDKAMAPHSSTLAWKIPWMEEPGRLQSMGWLRVGHDWATSLSLFTFMHWRRKWQHTPVFLPGESQGQGSLVGCCLWDRTELDTTEVTWWQRRRWHLTYYIIAQRTLLSTL